MPTPSVTLANTPGRLNPVNAEMWFRFTTNNFTAANFRYYAEVYTFSLSNTTQGKTLLQREKVSARPVTGDGHFSPHAILKSYVKNRFVSTLAYNIPYPLYNESSLIAYSVKVGVGHNPRLQYGNVSTSGISRGGVISLTAFANNQVIKPASMPTPTSGTYYYVRISLPTLHGFLVGDELTLSKNNPGINGFYNGKSTIVAVGTNYADVNIVYIANAYVSGSTANDFSSPAPNYIESGDIVDLISMRSESTVLYGFEGTRQYEQNAYDFADRFILKSNPSFFPTFPGLYSPNRNGYLTNYDFRFNWKPIYRNQDEVQTFMIQEANNISYVQIRTYDANKNVIDIHYVPWPGVNIQSNYIRMWQMEVGPRGWEGWSYSSTVGGSGTVTFIGASYYSIQVGATLAGGINYWSEAVRYQIVEPNCVYENVRIAYLNRAGGYDFFNFSLNSDKTINVARKEFTKPLNYGYAIGDRAQSTLSIDAFESYVANSDYMTEHDYSVLSEILTSPDVYWIKKDGTVIPILITDSVLKYKTKIKDKLLSMTINFKRSDKINVQQL